MARAVNMTGKSGCSFPGGCIQDADNVPGSEDHVDLTALAFSLIDNALSRYRGFVIRSSATCFARCYRTVAHRPSRPLLSGSQVGSAIQPTRSGSGVPRLAETVSTVSTSAPAPD